MKIKLNKKIFKQLLRVFLHMSKHRKVTDREFARVLGPRRTEGWERQDSH